MALPPWLNIQPAQFLQATQAGTQAGLQLRAQQQQAQQQAQENALRAQAQDEMRRVRQFEQEARIAQAAARQKSDELHQKLAFAQEERRMKDAAAEQMLKNQQLALAQKRFEQSNQPFTPQTKTVDGLRFGQVRPNAWVLAPEKTEPKPTEMQLENAKQGYMRMLQKLETDKADPLKMMSADTYEKQRNMLEGRLKALEEGKVPKTQVESTIPSTEKPARFKYDPEADDLVPFGE